MRRIVEGTLAVGVLLIGLGGQVFAQEPPTRLQNVDTAALAGFTGLITLAYYEDMDAAEEFYGEILGIKKTIHRDTWRLFPITPTAAIGMMDIHAAEDVEFEEKAAAYAFIVEDVEDVDRWRDYLKAKGVEITGEPGGDPGSLMRSVHFRDTDGYDVEIMAWLPDAR